MPRSGSGRRGTGRSTGPSHSALVSVAAVGHLRGALEIRGLVLRAGVALGGQRDRSRGEDEGGDQGLDEHGTSPLGAWAAWSDTRRL